MKDDRKLIELAKSSRSLKLVAKRLARAPHSVAAKAKKLGLSIR
jgi:hypothetical protein